MLNEQTFYDLGESPNSKIHSQTFCEAISSDKFKGWTEVGKVYNLKAHGKNLGSAKVVAVHECNKSDVYNLSLPSMLMSLASDSLSSGWDNKLDELTPKFYFVLFEKVNQLQLDLNG